MSSLLRLDRINTFYGAVQVHFDLSLEVEQGKIVSLLGACRPAVAGSCRGRRIGRDLRLGGYASRRLADWSSTAPKGR